MVFGLFKSKNSAQETTPNQAKINRRTFLKIASATLGVAATGGTIFSINAKPPSIQNLAETVAYLNAHSGVAKVDEWADNGGPVVVYAPELHFTSYHAKHYATAVELRNLFGLNLLGIEGHVGEVKDLDEIARGHIAVQERGVFHQFERNQADFEKREPRPIRNLDDLLGIEATLRLVRDGTMPVMGLEDDYTAQQFKAIHCLELVFQHYFANREYAIEQTKENLAKAKAQIKRIEGQTEEEFRQESESQKTILQKQIDYFTKTDASLFQDPIEEIKEEMKTCDLTKAEYLQMVKSQVEQEETELPKRIERQGMAIKYMDEYLRQLDPKFELPDYRIEKCRSKFDSPFYQKITVLKEKIMMDTRSTDSVKIILQEMTKRGLKLGMMCFGKAHRQQITDELQKRNASYIILRYE